MTPPPRRPPTRRLCIAFASLLLAACASGGSSPATSYRRMRVEQPATLHASSPLPAYPVGQLPPGTRGRVVARFSVTPAGTVDTTTLEILESSHPAFTAAVREAMPRLRFQPGEMVERECLVPASGAGALPAAPSCRGRPRSTGDYVRQQLVIPFAFTPPGA